ncbi:hypothetical protein T265_01958 [Opisthorchis viverrini]|uniref:Uncharacterized protein n=1 Tax=Opisthorchis viverrini TaxID=6198 RepID=A0A075AIM0_OPIVI|nr:hypothetical protein T265_01958 [Opisthorchis viverrini]KER31869.1 hypothetical protein T265_01958 [Opisthorchis viverrini]
MPPEEDALQSECMTTLSDRCSYTEAGSRYGDAKRHRREGYLITGEYIQDKVGRSDLQSGPMALAAYIDRDRSTVR